jgi:hypothetical protein
MPTKAGSVKDSVLRKKPAQPVNAVAALGILKALDSSIAPPVEPANLQRQHSEDYGTEYSYREDRRERKGFWERATGGNKEKERQREKERRDDHDQNELTRIIGTLRFDAIYPMYSHSYRLFDGYLL